MLLRASSYVLVGSSICRKDDDAKLDHRPVVGMMLSCQALADSTITRGMEAPRCYTSLTQITTKSISMISLYVYSALLHLHLLFARLADSQAIVESRAACWRGRDAPSAKTLRGFPTSSSLRSDHSAHRNVTTASTLIVSSDFPESLAEHILQDLIANGMLLPRMA